MFERNQATALFFILLITSVDPVQSQMKLTPLCMIGSAISGFTVTFTGFLAAQEAHSDLHPDSCGAKPIDPNDEKVKGDFSDEGFADDPHKLAPVSDEEALCFREMDLPTIHCAKSSLWHGMKLHEDNPGACFTACLPVTRPNGCAVEEWSQLNDDTVQKMAQYPNIGPDSSVLKHHHGAVSKHPKCGNETYELGASSIDMSDSTPSGTTRRQLRRHRAHRLRDDIKKAVQKTVADVKSAAKSVKTFTKTHSTIIKKIVKKVIIIVAVSVAVAVVSAVTLGVADEIMGAAAGAAEAGEAVAGAVEGTEVAVDATEAGEDTAVAAEDGDEAADAADEGDKAADAAEDGDKAADAGKSSTDKAKDLAATGGKKAVQVGGKHEIGTAVDKDTQGDFGGAPKSGA